MQRFVIFLDDSITAASIPEWIEDLFIKDLPYSLRIYIGSLLNEWIEIKEVQTKLQNLKSAENAHKNIEYDLSKLSLNNSDQNTKTDNNNNKNRHASFTTLASIIHSACSSMKQYLKNTNNEYFTFEIIWQFPNFETIDRTEDQSQNIINDLQILYGAFERFIDCNHGHIHILNTNDHKTPNILNSDEDSDEFDLFHIETIKEIFEEKCTLWNLKQSKNDKNMKKIFRQIIKPYSLTTIALKIHYEDKENINQNAMDIDQKEESAEPSNNQSFELNFDLISCSLHMQNDQNMNERQLIWKNFNFCWNEMKLIQIIDRKSFPSHLLVSDISLIQHMQNEPAMLVLSPCNERSEMLKNHFKNGQDIGWIIQFTHNAELENKYANTQNLKKNAFMNEDEWINLNADDQKTPKSESLEPQNMTKPNISSNYLIYLAVMDKKMHLIAHRIISDHQTDIVSNDYIHSLLNLTYKYSKHQIDKDTNNEKKDTFKSVKLSFFAYNPTNDCLIRTEDTFCDDEKECDLWKEYQTHLVQKHEQYLEKELKSKRQINASPIPSDVSSQSVTQSPANALLTSTFKKQRKRRKSRSNNRGLLALEAVRDKHSYASKTPAIKSKNTSKLKLKRTVVTMSANRMDRAIRSYKQHTTNRKIIKNMTTASKKLSYYQQQQQQQSGVKKQKVRVRAEEKEWLTADNILSVFDENGILRDKAKICEFENVQTENNEPRKDWKTLRMNELNARKKGHGYMHQNDSNWPIPPRYYGKESVEYEQKIDRIKKQYLNGIDNANGNLYEIIGDLMTNEPNLLNIHPMTIKHGMKNNKKHKKNEANSVNYCEKNKANIFGQVGTLLKKSMKRQENQERFRKIRKAIFELLWKDFKNNQDIHKKIKKEVAQNYVSDKFPGMFMVFSMQIQ